MSTRIRVYDDEFEIVLARAVYLGIGVQEALSIIIKESVENDTDHQRTERGD